MHFLLLYYDYIFMIISFGGTPGAGKSTIAKMIAKELDWPRYYIGGIRRQKASDRGMTLEEYNKLGETDPSTDLEVDEYQKELGEKEDSFIIEGRTSWHFIPHSLKIYLDVDLEEGAKRILKEVQGGNDRNLGEVEGVNDIEKEIKERMRSDNERYEKYFNIDCYDTENFDIVIDTTNLSEMEVFEKVMEEVRKKM